MPDGPPRSIAMEITNALSAGDSQRLAGLAIELMESAAVLRAEIATLKDQRDRKRRADRERVALQRECRATNATSGDSSIELQQTVVAVPTATTTTTTQSSSARDRLLSVVPDRAAWEGELRMCIDGARGARYKATAEQMETACRDYLGNGASREPNMAQFRAYIRRAVTGDAVPIARRRGGTGQRSYDNTVEALRDV